MTPEKEHTREGEPTVGLAERVTSFLARREAESRRRYLVPLQARADWIDLTHNDYLGLRDDTTYQQRALAAVEGLPVGAGASRLLGGEHPIFSQLETRAAALKGAPAALFFSSGYAANEALVASLSRFCGHLFYDSLIHASTIDGMRLSSVPKSRRIAVPHGELDALEKGLAESTSATNLIMAESVYSMDGDRAALEKLAELARRYRGLLVVDEAHAIGCMGPGGRGLSVAAGLDHEQVITVNTCGKALGVQGALVCGPQWLRELLINTGRPFIYSTAPSPWTAAALMATFDYLEPLEERRDWLARIAAELREHLQNLGYRVGQSTTHIIPIICGEDSKALSLTQDLETYQIRAHAIRPPTVPRGTARVRLSLHAGLSHAQIRHLKNAFEELRERHG